MKPEYLFIRILEGCNAGCFMCSFRNSVDRYRFPLADMRAILPRVYEEGIRYVRLTGGEPLLHPQICELVAEITIHGMQSSIITNGYLLERRLEALVEAGLGQVIVSLDGVSAESHDRIRATPTLFERAVRGLILARQSEIVCRVNTVCGPHNFREMPALQDLLTALEVHQWELSSLKLERPLEYSERDQIDIEEVIHYVYHGALVAGRLVPMGKIWCGNTAEERERYFRTGITPRADGECAVVSQVRYLDARNGRLFCCSLLPHRPGAEEIAVLVPSATDLSVLSPDVLRRVDQFRSVGPRECTGCSTTAAGYSNALLAGAVNAPWSY